MINTGTPSDIRSTTVTTDMNCYISSSSSRHRTLEDITRELAGLGFDRIELTGNVAFEDHIEAKIMKLRSHFGVEFLIHNYLPFLPEDFVLNLASAQEKNRRKTMEHIQRAVTLALDLAKIFTPSTRVYCMMLSRKRRIISSFVCPIG